jgi:hypothetical protein
MTLINLPGENPLAPLIAAVRDAIRADLLAEVRAEIRASHAEASPDRIILSLADAGRRYGVGRIELKRMIASGRLPAVERTCRGGRIGTFIHISDAERVLAGRKVGAA